MFEVKINDDNGQPTMWLRGRFDFRCVQDFQRLLKEPGRNWVVDLSDVEYLDSAALGMLLLLRERCGGEVARLRIRGAKGQTRQVLMIAKFDKMFSMDPS